MPYYTKQEGRMLMKPRPRSSHFTTPTCTPSNPALAIKTEPAPRVGTAGCTPSLYPTKPKATSHTHLPFHSVSQVSALPPPPAGNGYKSPLRKKIFYICFLSDKYTGMLVTDLRPLHGYGCRCPEQPDPSSRLGAMGSCPIFYLSACDP